MAIQTMLLNAICRAEKMDKNVPLFPPEITAANVIDVVRLLRDNSFRHEQLLDQIWPNYGKSNPLDLLVYCTWIALL